MKDKIKICMAINDLRCGGAERVFAYIANGLSSKYDVCLVNLMGASYTFAHEQYNKFIEQGFSDFVARKKVSELLGHHRDDVTRIYLSGGDDV